MAEGRDVPVLVLTTVPGEGEAEALARALVKSRLAACVSRIPGVKSLFHWDNRLDSATETLLLIKTLSSRAPRVTAKIQELSTYEVPEVLVFPAAAGHGPYLEWMRTELEAESDAHDPIQDHHSDD